MRVERRAADGAERVAAAAGRPEPVAKPAADGAEPVPVATGRPTSLERPAAAEAEPRSPAVQAFDAVAERFDQRFGSWASVAAQRRAVRRHLLRAFPVGSSVLELGAGTGEDALFLAERGRHVLLTDGSPAMVAQALSKVAARRAPREVEREVLRERGAKVPSEAIPEGKRTASGQGGSGRAPVSGRLDAACVALESLESFARDWHAARTGEEALFDGAFSNFAALNCVTEMGPVARGLARLLRPGAPALLVVFGPFAPGEVVVQLARGDVRAAFRRLTAADAPARLGGRAFSVRYPSPRELAGAFSPYFRLARTRGIGVFVPPSAAEPTISRFPRLLTALEWVDHLAAAPLALLGDHVLLHFVRTGAPVGAGVGR